MKYLLLVGTLVATLPAAAQYTAANHYISAPTVPFLPPPVTAQRVDSAAGFLQYKLGATVTELLALGMERKDKNRYRYTPTHLEYAGVPVYDITCTVSNDRVIEIELYVQYEPIGLLPHPIRLLAGPGRLWEVLAARYGASQPVNRKECYWSGETATLSYSKLCLGDGQTPTPCSGIATFTSNAANTRTMIEINAAKKKQAQKAAKAQASGQ